MEEKCFLGFTKKIVTSESILLFKKIFDEAKITKEDSKKYLKYFEKENISDLERLKSLDTTALKTIGVKMGDAGQIMQVLKMLDEKSARSLLGSSISSSSLTDGSDRSLVELAMLSFNVSTMDPFASSVFNNLMEKGVVCWSCTKSIPHGLDWRESIQAAIERSSHFVMLINQDWLDSGECQHEFKIALALYNKQKKPKLIPVIFPDAQAQMNTGVLLGITANFNGIMVNGSSPDSVEMVVNALVN